MISLYYKGVKETDTARLHDVHPGSWVHAESPNEKELDTLAEALGLNRDLLQDAVDFYEVPRFESEEGVAYFFTRFPNEKDGETGTAPVLFAVTPTAVVSVCGEHPAFLEKYLTAAPPATVERAGMFLTLMQAMNTAYRGTLFSIRREVQKSRVNLNKIRNQDIVRLVALESTLNDFLGALNPTHAALRTILGGSYLPLHEDDRDLIEDIQLEEQQIIETAKSNLKTIQNIRSSYMAIVTNNLNQVIKILTALTIILTFPTIIGSLFGMNVPLPFSDSPHAFFGITLFAMLTMGIAGYIFMKQEWM